MPDKTRAAIDDEGWYHTGDIGVLAPGRRITLVGRCVEMLKLSNGVFVSPSRLETIFAEVEAVRRVFVTGDAASPSVVAVVIPSTRDVDEATILAQLRVAARMQNWLSTRCRLVRSSRARMLSGRRRTV